MPARRARLYPQLRGPGFTHNYLEPLEALGDRRQVILYDQLGCGRSDQPDDTSLWTVDRFVEEVAQVRAALGLDRMHLFGSSWGGMLAMQYVLDRRPELESLILCGSPASMIRWVTDYDELLSAQPPEVLQVIRQHEEAGFTACPEYQAAARMPADQGIGGEPGQRTERAPEAMRGTEVRR